MSARACFFSFEAIERSKSLLECVSKPLSTGNHCSSMLLFPSKALSSMLLFPRKHFRQCFFFLRNSFRNRSVSNVHCFELYFVRLHRRRKAPYANLAYIYIYIYYTARIRALYICTYVTGWALPNSELGKTGKTERLVQKHILLAHVKLREF